MAHVKISAGNDVPSILSVEVDGIEINQHILAEGFGIEFPTSPGEVAKVHCIIAADSLGLDLPGSVIEALRQAPAHE